MSASNSTESSPIVNALERHVEDEPEVHVLNQEEVNEQMRSYIARLTNQLEDLTRLIREMTTAQHPTSYPRAATSASYIVETGISPTLLLQRPLGVPEAC